MSFVVEYEFFDTISRKCFRRVVAESVPLNDFPERLFFEIAIKSKELGYIGGLPAPKAPENFGKPLKLHTGKFVLKNSRKRDGAGTIKLCTKPCPQSL